jgi:1-deoxy-D-xylulose-5-phosphate reductoisomerase
LGRIFSLGANHSSQFDEWTKPSDELSMRNVAILGSTGSIGRNTLQVIAASNRELQAFALTTHRQIELAIRQCCQHGSRWLLATCPETAAAGDFSALPADTNLGIGLEAVDRIVASDDVDIVVSAIVGSAGLQGTLTALKAGKRVALANKETLVMAGETVMRTAAENRAELIPIDSEHSAVFQALSAGRRPEVRRILLTASGGPFLRYSAEQLDDVSVEQALSHPTWNMGPKITVDSATMMNKALEIIEARWLFDLDPRQIAVVIHPQSVVQSLVEFQDGSVIAQMSPPDMKLPIQYALMYPERRNGMAERFDWSMPMNLDFEPPDLDRFPALQLGYDVAATGGTAGAVLNAANEAAVHEFLAGRIRFNEIVPSCRSVLENHNYISNPTLDELLEVDLWARKEVLNRVCA